MTQTVIKDNLVAYLDFKANQLCQEIESQNLIKEESISRQVAVRQHIRAIKKLLTSNGRCFAFSVADAAYAATGYGDWWEAILVQAATWKGNTAELNKPVQLDHLLPSHHLHTGSKQPETLDKIFERVLNTIVVEHAVTKKSIHSFMLEDQTQINFLGENEKYFEIMINNKIQKICGRDIIGGYFKTEQLAEILRQQKDVIAGNICLVHAEDHAMNIRYENNQWVLYDPNYKQDDIKTMTKRFDKAEDLVIEMKQRLRTESIAIQLATLNPNQNISFSFYENLEPNAAIKLLQKEGFQSIAQRVPRGFKKILELAKKNNEVNTALGEAIYHKNKENWSGLLVTALYNPTGLNDLLELARNNKEIAEAIAIAIPQANNDNWNALHMMQKNCSASTLVELFDLATQNKAIKDSIIKAIDFPNKKGKTPRSLISTNPILNNLFLSLEMQSMQEVPVKSRLDNKSQKKQLTIPSSGKTRRIS